LYFGGWSDGQLSLDGKEILPALAPKLRNRGICGFQGIFGAEGIAVGMNISNRGEPKQMITTKKALVAGAALAGLLVGVSAPVHASNLLSGLNPSLRAAGDQDTGSKDKTATKAKVEKHACKGQNSCKGKGGCGTTKGKNDCKGKGECSTDPKHPMPKSGS
jgi:hypothetical protein